MKALLAIALSPLFLVMGIILILAGALATITYPGTWKDGVWTRIR